MVGREFMVSEGVRMVGTTSALLYKALGRMKI